MTLIWGWRSIHDTTLSNDGLHSNKEPVYFLSLDALSAYDRVVIEHAVRCTYLAVTQDEGLIYLDNRLRSRRTLVSGTRR